ncbi:SIN3-HDAC complex-associated factor isoform X1 [Hemitrygon akajei]|uniref:SIN3-HDAC complex-associated factor isoform X1 n=1 Tax=Hemitrygon akajei TaxID=2704970 RepID=UPI003BF9E128
MFGFHKPKMYRSLDGCCICRAKSSSSRFTDSKRYEKDFQSCFGLNEARSGEICNACVLLVKRWKKLPVGSKKNWNHVVDVRAGPSLKTALKPKKAKSLTGSRIKASQISKIQKELKRQIMPHKQKMKKTQVGTESRPTSAKEPRAQVHFTSGDTEQETAATSTISKEKDQRELCKREGRSMRKREQPELQIPVTIETESESESEVDSDSLEKSDEDGGKSFSGNIEKTLMQIMRKLEKLNALKVIQKNDKYGNYV